MGTHITSLLSAFRSCTSLSKSSNSAKKKIFLHIPDTQTDPQEEKPVVNASDQNMPGSFVSLSQQNVFLTVIWTLKRSWNPFLIKPKPLQISLGKKITFFFHANFHFWQKIDRAKNSPKRATLFPGLARRLNENHEWTKINSGCTFQLSG